MPLIFEWFYLIAHLDIEHIFFSCHWACSMITSLKESPVHVAKILYNYDSEFIEPNTPFPCWLPYSCSNRNQMEFTLSTLCSVPKLLKNPQLGLFEELIGCLRLKGAKAESLLVNVMESSRSGNYLKALYLQLQHVARTPSCSLSLCLRLPVLLLPPSVWKSQKLHSSFLSVKKEIRYSFFQLFHSKS